MSKARDLANLASAGNPLDDGVLGTIADQDASSISVGDITATGTITQGGNNVVDSSTVNISGDTLAIENNGAYLGTPLISGDFALRTLHINGTLSSDAVSGVIDGGTY